MATFCYNRFSGESVNSQWSRYLQNKAYVSDVGEIVSQNRKELQATLKTASAEQKQAFQQVCGTLDNGFLHVGQHLQEVNCNISGLRGEISDMAAMLDWNLSLLIEQQRVTNELLGHVVSLLRIPNSQKQRVYYIEQGLKYLTNAIREGIDSPFYADALEGFKKAEQIERKDYITLNKIGWIYLHSRQHMNISIAEDYFLKSAREALAEDNAGGTPTASNLPPEGNQSLIYSESPFKAATAEAYLYAGRACYLQNKVRHAIDYAGTAYRIVPTFLEAGFEQAKYLAANDQDDEAISVLREVINKDRYFAVKTLSDTDLASKPPVLKLLGDFHTKAISQATKELSRCQVIITEDSTAIPVFEEAEHHLSQNSFLSAMAALDLLTVNHQRPYNTYCRGEEFSIRRQTSTPALTLVDFITKENESAKHLERLIKETKRAHLIDLSLNCGWGGAVIGFIVGFFRGCAPSAETFLGTWFITFLFCAVIGAAIGSFIGEISEPTIY